MLLQLLFDFSMTVLFYIFRVFPIDNTKIVFSSYLGQGYGDNPKYIAEHIIEQNKKYKLVWLVKNTNSKFPDEIIAVKYRSLRSIYELCTAKVWIDNRRKPIYIRKRKGQYYIMTWHSNIALKKVEGDVEKNLGPRYVKLAKRDSNMADLILAGSKWEKECMRRAFWYSGPILEAGYPRQDIFVNNKEYYHRKVREHYGLTDNVNILLYAPTFRKTKDTTSLKQYSLDWEKTLSALKHRFGGEWVGMIRLHPNIVNLRDKLQIPPEVIDVTSYEDAQELIIACDCLITDYSSTIIEAGIAHKTGFIFATDYDDYKKDRDVYFDIRTDLPFLFSETNDQLYQNILDFDEESYNSKLTSFLCDTYGIICNGTASEKVCNIIDEVINRSAS